MQPVRVRKSNCIRGSDRQAPGHGDRRLSSEARGPWQLGHLGRVCADGKTLASASHDRTVKLWDAKTGGRLQTVNVGIALDEPSFNATGSPCSSGPRSPSPPASSTSWTDSTGRGFSTSRRTGRCRLSGLPEEWERTSCIFRNFTKLAVFFPRKTITCSAKTPTHSGRPLNSLDASTSKSHRKP